MKKLFIVAIAIICGIFCLAQSNANGQNYITTGQIVKETQKMQIEGVSPYTAILILELSKDDFRAKISKSDSLRAVYGIKQINGVDYINSFVFASNKSNLAKYGFIPNPKEGKVMTGLIPIDRLQAMASDKDIEYIEVAQKVKLKLDYVRSDTHVKEVHQGTSLSHAYTGNGVVVGVIDMGIDYTHPTFYDESHTNYRIKRVWEQSANNGQHPAGYSYGRELTTQSAILASGTDDSSESHATHVTGIAAGSGAGTNGLFKGIAYESDIVVVSSDFTDVGLKDGIEYIMDYAQSVNKPCVINLSIGGHIGPHDGTSSFDQFCDGIVGPGKLLVGAAGNEGADDLFISKNFTSTDTLIKSFVSFAGSYSGTDGESVFDIWGNTSDDFSVSVAILNTNNNQIESQTPFVSVTSSDNTYNYTLRDNDSYSPDECSVSIASEVNPFNNKPHTLLYVDNFDQDDDFRWIVVMIKSTTSAQIKMWANDAYFTANSYGAPFVGGSNSYTVGEIGGTGNNMISVGAYTTKNNYVSYANDNVTISYYSEVGDIAPFSSKGPTADNRTKPDIVAPGNIVVSSFNRFDDSYTSNSDEVVYKARFGTTNWYYGSMQGTSMATPVVTGIIALWLQANPQLTPARALQVLKSSATIDGFTGNIPTGGDNTWGWGKVNALSGISSILGDMNAAPVISDDINVFFYPNPNHGQLIINADCTGTISMEILDATGRILYSYSDLQNGVNELNIDHISSGIYFIRFNIKGRIETRKLIVE